MAKRDSMTLAYFGGAAFKITTANQKQILIDPYLSKNPLCKEGLESFCDADLILVTHGAFDHLGDTVTLMEKSRAILVCGADVAEFAMDSGVPKDRIKATLYGDEKEFAGIRIKTVEAKHQSRIKSGNNKYQGIPLGYVLTTENDIRIYHPGDTSIFSDMQLIGMLHRPNIFIVGVAGVAAGFPCEMSPREAALAALWVSPDIAIPIHYPAGSKAPRQFARAVREIAPNVRPVLLEPNHQITYRRHQVS